MHVLCCLCHLGMQAGTALQQWNIEGLDEFVSKCKASVNRICHRGALDTDQSFALSYIRFVCLSGLALDSRLHISLPVKFELLHEYCCASNSSRWRNAHTFPLCHLEQADSLAMLSSSVLRYLQSDCNSSLSVRALLWQVDPSTNEEEYVAFLEGSFGKISADMFFELAGVLTSSLGTKYYYRVNRVWNSVVSLSSEFLAHTATEDYGPLRTQSLLVLLETKNRLLTIL